MKLPCEIFVNDTLPAIRSLLAKELMIKHGLTQTEVGERLGITQAAVSQYMRNLRGYNINNIKKNKKIINKINDLALEISNSNADQAFIMKKICEMCHSLRSF